MQDTALSAPLALQPALNLDVLALVADSVICTSEDGRILVFNQAAEQAFGYKPSEAIGQPVEMLLPQGARADHVQQVHNFASADDSTKRLMGHRREVRGQRKNGDEFPAEAMVSRQTVDGKTILTVVLRDITERKALEELREAAGRELDHRLRNVLAVVTSLVSLSAASARNVEELKESLIGRLTALSKTQSALLSKQQRASLSELLLAELAQYQNPDGANIDLKVAPVEVGARAAQILALAVHELATNSAKYGALGSTHGCVAVTSALKGEGDQAQLVIEWREAGGPTVKRPEREGFGTRLIKQVVAKALRAEVTMDYRPEGLIFRLTMPKALLEADPCE